MTQPYTVQQMTYTPLFRAANAALGAGGKLGLPLGKLDPDSIVEASRKKAGLTDMGADTYRPFLERICQACASAPVTPLARFVMQSIFQTSAVARLRAQDYVTRHPELEKIPIERPVFIVGFPRTGTTLVQHLLALEPGARGLQFWELLNATPVHDDPISDHKKRLAAAEQMLKFVLLTSPETPVVHDITATTLEECWYLLSHSFAVYNWDLQSGLDHYGDWMVQQDMRVPYREYRRTLQVMAHWQPTGRFVLKCPDHMWFLDSLLDVFPDAAIVWTHRDPVDVIASYCSMVSLTRRLYYGYIDGDAIGAHIVKRFHEGIERAMEVRRRVGEEHFYDINFEDLKTDPVASIEGAFEHFDLNWTSHTEHELRQWLAQPRRDKPGCHSYGPNQWGLDPAAIREQYAGYLDRFDVAYPGRKARRPAEASPAHQRFPRSAPDSRPALSSPVAKPS